jgi:quinol monooxygenase YgiN
MDKLEISAGNGVVTLINLFHVEAQNQEKLIAILRQGGETLLGKQPGYVSFALHQSQDGEHAVVYSQWRTAEDLQAARANPAVQQYFGRVREIATFEPITYRVAHVHHV